jgi:hypothetical protein
MRDKSPLIYRHHIHGTKLLNDFSVLCINFSSALTNFQKELHRCYQ